MRYWTFDAVQLIADEDKIKRNLISITAQLDTAREMAEHPDEFGVDKSELPLYIELLEMRQHEFQMYLDMITLGMNNLPEAERLILRWWIQEGYDDDFIIEHAAIKSQRELEKIKRISLEKFKRLVMPR